MSWAEVLVAAERRRRRQTVIWTLVLAVLMAGLSWAVGVSWFQSLLLFTGVTTVGAAVLALDHLDDDAQLPPLDPAGRSEGTRREVSRLSWALAGADNRVGDRPYRRVRAIAAHRLAMRGIDVSELSGEGAARALLGSVGYDQLVAETAAPPTQRTFAACLTLLERLDDSPSAPSILVGKRQLMTANLTAPPPIQAESSWGRP